MSEINNNEDKQGINNIKALYKMNADNIISNLFHEVKRIKQQAFNLTNTLKERINSIKLLKEQQQKEFVESETNIPVENFVSKIEKRQEKIEEDSKSFAELFASSMQEKENRKEEEVKSEVLVSNTKNIEGYKKQKVETLQKPITETKKENKPFIPSQREQKTSLNQNGYKQFTPRYNNDKNYQNKNNFNSNQQGFKKPYFPQNNNQRQQTYNSNYNNGQKTFNNLNNFKKSYLTNQNKPLGSYVNSQNRTLMGIIPKKTSSLTSASEVFATKERSFGNKRKTSERSSEEEKKVNKKSLLRRGLIEEQNIEERMVTRKLKLKRPKTEVTTIVSTPVTNAVITTPNLTVKILSEKIGKPVTEIIKQLMVLGIMTTINSSIDFPTAELVSSELGVTLELKLEKTFEEKLKENAKLDNSDNNEKRPPIVTIVGHVDHGKTSLLDYIRRTHVTSKEAGGITQAIGAYSINWKGEDITFIDTPGHEAFINMRKRGTEITDVAVLIVAGDDGIKPQTVEAIKHVKEAKVPMIVAITKIDKQNINIEKIKEQLTEYEILPEEWGGDAIIVPVSSVTGEGIEKLLEMILLVAEMQNLKCNKKRNAVGTIIEAVLDKNKGPIANIIVQNGTLKVGDNVVSGFAFGKIRAMTNDLGKNIVKAGPSMPVSILGLDSVPSAGDTFQVVDEKFSKQVIEERKIRIAQEKIENDAAKSLDEFLATPAQEEKKKLNLILKANSQGSVEALKSSLLEIKNEEVKIEIISSGVGNVTENDVQLAKVSNASILTFGTKVLSKISNFAKQNKIEIYEYNVIYKAIEDVEKLLKNLMAPKFVINTVGHAEVRALFKISSVGTIAGCYCTDGKIVKNGDVKVIRKGNVVFEGKIANLKREKDDVKEVASGYECGIKIDNFNDVLEGDILECLVKEQIKNE